MHRTKQHQLHLCFLILAGYCSWHGQIKCLCSQCGTRYHECYMLITPQSLMSTIWFSIVRPPHIPLPRVLKFRIGFVSVAFSLFSLSLYFFFFTTGIGKLQIHWILIWITAKVASLEGSTQFPIIIGSNCTFISHLFFTYFALYQLRLLLLGTISPENKAIIFQCFVGKHCCVLYFLLPSLPSSSALVFDITFAMLSILLLLQYAKIRKMNTRITMV